MMLLLALPYKEVLTYNINDFRNDHHNSGAGMDEISRDELIRVIKDFLEMGHVDNIVAMFDRDSRYFSWTGSILDDERFAVRLGVSVLFEELQARDNRSLHLAVPALEKLLDSDQPLLRGEALSVLAIINGETLRHQAERMRHDSDAQVREIAADILASLGAAKV